MKYDDASWHYGGDYPADLPPEAGATHIGMFVAWCQLNGLGGKIHSEELPEMLVKLTDREFSPGAWFIAACDEKFTNEDLNEEGNEFARVYYDFKNGRYVDDYEKTVGVNLQTLYHVPDSWDTYEKLSPVICSRYQEWRKPKKKWRFLINWIRRKL